MSMHIRLALHTGNSVIDSYGLEATICEGFLVATTFVPHRDTGEWLDTQLIQAGSISTADTANTTDHITTTGRANATGRTTDHANGTTAPAASEDLHTAALLETAFAGWRNTGDPSLFRHLPLAPAHTAFAAQIRAALLALAPSQTISYHSLAACTHSPNAIRAAASACARNPLPLIVPCHAVLPTPAQHMLASTPQALNTPDFSPGKYAFGSDLKLAILRHESCF
ncbi:methylated-DNA--[protein]-cysteine S-methyltransferase [Arcanobacterium haemolyticum]|nr:methylated-DNA--[protein]-cysteine S-methyltransferase [Arcanobacterium haemolyticum]QCX46303.1 methylated-DNA--[protein]-cysteine S-methyltransferase [Arcanobacterium haemolyticum]